MHYTLKMAIHTRVSTELLITLVYYILNEGLVDMHKCFICLVCGLQYKVFHLTLAIWHNILMAIQVYSLSFR